MSNEKGFTLIELLGALILFSLITISAVSVTAQAMKQSDKAEQTNSLQNDATYFTQALRTAFENDTLSGTCFKGEGFKSDHIDLSLTEGNELTDLNFSYTGKEDSPGCFNSQSEIQNLQVNFTISHEDDKGELETFEVDTAFTKPTAKELTVFVTQPSLPPTDPSEEDNDDTVGDENGDNNEDEDSPGENTDNPDSGESEESSDPKDNDNEVEQPGDYETNPTPPDNNTPSNKCIEAPWKKGDYYGNTKINESLFADWTYCNPFTVHDGSLWVTNETTINQLAFTVEGYLFVAGGLTAYNTSTIKVNKDSDIQGLLILHQWIPMETEALHAGEIKLETYSSISATKDIYVDKSVLLNSNANIKASGLNIGTTFRMNSNSIITLTNALNVSNNTDFQSNTTVKVGTDMTIGTTIAQENTNIAIGNNLTVTGNMILTGNPLIVTKGDATFKGEYLSENNSRIEVGRDLTFEKKLTLKGSSKLYSKGNITVNGNTHIQDNAILYSDGNIHIKGDLSPNNGGGTICAKGSIIIDQPNNASDLEILPNNQKCQK
jgi:type II secretory pathway pseudopilin PulG